MRIFYSHYLTSPQHPAAQMVSAIGDELRRRGHEVTVHASRSAADASAGSAPPSKSAHSSRSNGVTARLRRTGWFAKELAGGVRMYRRDLSALRQAAPDVALIRQDAYCLSMHLAAKRLGVPVVTYADAPIAHEIRRFNPEQRWHPPGLVEAQERWQLRASRAAVTVSHTARDLLEQYGLGTPVEVVPNGISSEDFPLVSPQQRQRIREELKIQTPHVIVFQGSFRPFHGIARLAELVQRLRDREDVTWLFIGDGPEREPLEQVIGRDVPVVFTGRQPKCRMGALLSAADIAVAPYPEDIEPFYFCPLKVLEYAAAGCAVVARWLGDMPELLDQGRAGLLLQDDQLETWEVGLRYLLDDPGYRRYLGDRARTFVHAECTWQSTAARVESVLARVVHTELGGQPIPETANTAASPALTSSSAS